MEAVTPIFSNPSQRYVRVVARRWLARYWWLLAMPLLVSMVGAIWRWELAVVALMLVLLVYPFVLLIVYFNYALTLRARREILPHRIGLEGDRLTIAVIPDDEHPHRLPDEAIPLARISAMYPYRDYCVIEVGSGVGDLLILPAISVSSTGSDSPTTLFLQSLVEKLREIS